MDTQTEPINTTETFTNSFFRPIFRIGPLACDAMVRSAETHTVGYLLFPFSLARLPPQREALVPHSRSASTPYTALTFDPHRQVAIKEPGDRLKVKTICWLSNMISVIHLRLRSLYMIHLADPLGRRRCKREVNTNSFDGNVKRRIQCLSAYRGI